MSTFMFQWHTTTYHEPTGQTTHSFAMEISGTCIKLIFGKGTLAYKFSVRYCAGLLVCIVLVTTLVTTIDHAGAHARHGLTLSRRVYDKECSTTSVPLLVPKHMLPGK